MSNKLLIKILLFTRRAFLFEILLREIKGFNNNPADKSILRINHIYKYKTRTKNIALILFFPYFASGQHFIFIFYVCLTYKNVSKTWRNFINFENTLSSLMSWTYFDKTLTKHYPKCYVIYRFLNFSISTWRLWHIFFLKIVRSNK